MLQQPCQVLCYKNSPLTVQLPLRVSSIFMKSNLSATGRWTTSFRICNQLRVSSLARRARRFPRKIRRVRVRDMTSQRKFCLKWRLFNLVFILRSQHLFYTLLSLVFFLRMDSVLNSRQLYHHDFQASVDPLIHISQW